MLLGGAAGECCPLVKRNQPRKFTSENISRIKDWVAQGVGRDEIANRLEVSVGSLQVTCSRLGISLRRRSLPGGSGATQPPDPVQRSIEHAAQIKCTLLIQNQNRQAAFDLPLHHDLIEELALEASSRGQTIAHLIGEILMQVMEKDLVDDTRGQVASQTARINRPPARPDPGERWSSRLVAAAAEDRLSFRNPHTSIAAHPSVMGPVMSSLPE